jgi:GAF domain-containing protein
MAESLAAGVRSMRTGPQPEIVAAATYVFLARERRILVQSDTREPPAPPPTLLSEYRVLAQLLAPVLIAGQLVGTVSVHQQDRVRTWTSAEVEALSGVQREVESWYLAHRSDRSGQRPVPAGWRPHRPRT